MNEPALSLNVKGQPRKKPKETSPYQSVEAHRSTACSPVFMFCNISPSTSVVCIITKIWLITEDSLRIKPMTIHQSRHPASMKMCSKYLHMNRNKIIEKEIWSQEESTDVQKGNYYPLYLICPNIPSRHSVLSKC